MVEDDWMTNRFPSITVLRRHYQKKRIKERSHGIYTIAVLLFRFYSLPEEGTIDAETLRIQTKKEEKLI